MYRDIYLSVTLPFVNNQTPAYEEVLYPDYYRLLENNSRVLPEDSTFFLLAPEKPIMVLCQAHAVFYFPLFTMRDHFTHVELKDFYKLWLRERQNIPECGQEPRCVY